MAQKYLDYQGLVYVWTKIKTLLGGKVDTITYDTTNKKITKTIAGTTTDVVTSSNLVLDGGGVKSIQVGTETAVTPDNTGKISLPAYPVITGKKDKQTAVTDPTANGTAVAFIDTISQNENGDITVTKKTVRTMGASGSSHAAGLVPDTPSTAGTTKFLREDGTWAEPDLSGKADKVSGATSGNFAGLDSNGNLTDSGKKAADFANASHTHGNITNDGKLQTTDVAVADGDKLVITDASDSNKVARTSVEFDGSTTNKALTPKGTWETFLQSHQDISGKADKVTSATNGNFAGLDSNGNLTDSGKKPADFVLASTVGAASGICPLDASGIVDSQYLPSYVDDVIEIVALSATAPATASVGDIYYNTTSKKLFTATGANTWGTTGADPESGKIYVLMADSGDYSANSQFRWGGTDMVKLADGGVSAITNAEIDAAYAAA